MERIVVRQPVFDKNQAVFGYKILILHQRHNSIESSACTESSLKEMESTFLLMGFERITRGKKAFVDLTASLCAGETDIHLPQDLTVVEISHCPEAGGEALLGSCRELKEKGYVIAVGSSFPHHADFLPLMDLADIVKIPANETTAPFSGFLEAQRAKEKRFLAEKVDTRAQLAHARDTGFDYFQGSFFSEPVIISGRDMPQYDLTQLRLLHEVNKPSMRYGQIEAVIKQDVSLSYKLLKFINSAFFGSRREVSSIKQALTLMGENEIRRWTSLAVLAGLGKEKPAELVVASLIRANFCELLAARTGLADKVHEAFMMGLFSTLDVFLGRPLKEIMQEMPLPEDIKLALCGKRSDFKKLLDLVRSYEAGDIRSFLNLASKLRIKEGTVTDLYLQSIDRAEDALQLYGPQKASVNG